MRPFPLALLFVTFAACSAGETQVLFGSPDGGSPVQTTDAGADDGTPDAAGPDGGGFKPPCKRGIAYGYNSVADLRALSWGIGWWYNWSTKPDNPEVAAAHSSMRVAFVPMVWGGTFDVDAVEAEIPSDARYLLAFNEPNFGEQANLTPTDAAALWPKVEEIARSRDLKIVSPALNYCGGSCNVTDPFDWLDQFFAACPNCQVDYIAMHWYACSKEALAWYLGQFKAKYKRPLWLTEFSCHDQADVSLPVQQQYMKDALELLEADPMVFRYAWFTGRSPSRPEVELLAGDGQLTPLGLQYVSAPAACK